MCPKSFSGVKFALGALLQGGIWSFTLTMAGNTIVCHTSTMPHPGIHYVETQYLVHKFNLIMSQMKLSNSTIAGFSGVLTKQHNNEKILFSSRV